MKRWTWTVALVCAAIVAPWSYGQGTYPDRPIRMVLPFSAGGGTDAVGRIVAKGLADRLKQQVIVDNRAGAGGTIGTDIVAKAAPDGYTLLFASASHSWNVILAPKGTPRPIVERLNREINAVIASAEVQAKFAELGLDVLDPATPEGTDCVRHRGNRQMGARDQGRGCEG